MPRVTFKQRLFAKIKVPTDPDGCWLWTASTDRHGYGKIARDGRPVLAYHATYEMYNGPVPPEARLTHVCREKLCVRPDHLAPQTLEQRLFAKIKVSIEPDGCWIWAAGTDRNGYGKTRRDGRYVPAHRAVYEVYCGPTPAGMQLDHICHVRACVNPEHLRPVTSKQNHENRAGANKNSRSGVRGVYWCTRSGRWRVEVMHDGRKYRGGYFDDLNEAAEAARALRNRLYTHNNTDRTETDA